MDKIVPISQIRRILGTWKYCDGFAGAEFSFTWVDGRLVVTVVDSCDSETPEIYDVSWSEDKLLVCFAVHWSNGRFAKYRVSVGPNENRLEAIITSTVQELWERQ